jgi:CRP/FNR family transcriptional regulator, cyclic AMP receptor protein
MDRGRVAAIPFFAALPDEELDVVAGVATEVNFAVGEALTTQGEFGHGLFVIESGSAEILRDGARVNLVGPGAVVGEVAVLASGRRIASVVAVSPVRAIALFKRDVWNLEREAPEAGRRLRAALEVHVPSSPDPSDGA